MHCLRLLQVNFKDVETVRKLHAELQRNAARCDDLFTTQQPNYIRSISRRRPLQ